MKLTKRQVRAIGHGMDEYNQLKEKDKNEKITEERILKVGGKVKYAILKNWSKLQSEHEEIMTVITDKFRDLGGRTEKAGEGYIITYLDNDAMEKAEKISKKTDRKKEKDKLREKAKENSKKYDEFQKLRPSIIMNLNLN